MTYYYSNLLQQVKRKRCPTALNASLALRLCWRHSVDLGSADTLTKYLISRRFAGTMAPEDYITVPHSCQGTIDYDI